MMLVQKASFLSGIVGLCSILLPALTGLAQETGKQMLTMHVRVHLMTGLEFVENRETINNWVTPENFTDSVLPEVNRIWKPAGIQWKADSVVVEAAKTGPELESTLRRIEKREEVEIPTFRQLFAETGRNPKLINLYLIPCVGKANGIALRGGTVALVAVWRPKGPDDHRRAPLVMSERGASSVAKACAHELGHTLGLVHPDEREIERLMQAGPGTELTPEEIITAREGAAKRGK
jgi:hypothetical protein